MERNFDTPLLGDTDEEITCHPEVVSHRDTLARTDLELPLRRHNLSVDTANVNTSIETSAIMRLNEITGENFASTCTISLGRVLFGTPRTLHTSTAVVRALRAGETALGPTVWSAIYIKKSILLFETEPRDLSLGGVHGFLGMITIVGLVWSTVIVVALGKHENVLATSEGVLEDGSGTEINIRVITRGLVGGGTVEVPDTELPDISDFLAHGLGRQASVNKRTKI